MQNSGNPVAQLIQATRTLKWVFFTWILFVASLCGQLIFEGPVSTHRVIYGACMLVFITLSMCIWESKLRRAGEAAEQWMEREPDARAQ
jgi:hypothetical protein